MAHKQKDKGDIAVAKTIADLTVKSYSVFVPVVTEHLPFDLIAYKDNKSIRIQTKYCSDGKIKNKTSWADKMERIANTIPKQILIITHSICQK